MFKHYNVFKTLPQDFLSRIHIACVTENDNIKALIVDCDDEVYAIGKDYNDTSEPVRLDAICKIEVCDFSFGRGHVATLTRDGHVFMWGQNACHQCGNGGKEYIKTPTQIHFQEEKVQNILCGWDHTLALTESGSVYTWGRNILAQCGTGSRINVKFPEKLMIGKVKSIACGAGHSLVLLENGQVYGWGENGDGQLGIGRETHCELSPALVSEGLTRVKKIVCGSYHTIALSTDGCLYTWGYNDYGQLGLGHTERRHTPQKLESYSGGPFTDVAALWCKDISVACKENGKYFIWGQNSHGDWPVPTETKANSFNDAFALHVLSIPVTYERIYFEKNDDYKSAQKESILLTIGKISFNTKNIIGRGASGTRVFRGLFEGSLSVAVKRTDNFEITDKEIEFLRELVDQNLVRYYATESDGIFRYIAIEMADMTFADLIERKRNGEFRDMNDIILLEEISKGLAYLHSHDIIHCDIRPQNALISAPMRPHGNRRAMLTDFSVSNELTSKNKLLLLSLTVAEGWIAREVLQSEESIFIPTKAIDVFALGCLFYYMLNDGQHPFGDRFHRQGNVYDGRYDINALKKRESLCKYHLIEATIDGDPTKRPTIDAVLKHPMFWDPKKSLLFIENASNRLRKEKEGLLLDSLESRATDVTNRNWMRILTEEVQSDLKMRRYNELSVKDLLRAIRNKYQHYDELSECMKQSLGLKPDRFASYFTQKFPLLLAHTYIVFQQCKAENDFKDYYSDSFDFKPLPTIKSDALFLVV